MKCDEVELGESSSIYTILSTSHNLHYCDVISIAPDVPVHSKPGRDPDWKQLYKENLSLRLNWQRGNCDVIDCKGHKDRCV